MHGLQWLLVLSLEITKQWSERQQYMYYVQDRIGTEMINSFTFCQDERIIFQYFFQNVK